MCSKKQDFQVSFMSYEHALDKLGKIFNSFIFRCQKRLAPKKKCWKQKQKIFCIGINSRNIDWNVSVLVVSSLFSLEKKYLKFVTLSAYIFSAIFKKKLLTL